MPKNEDIITEFVNPPIPNRSHDWIAYQDGAEDGITGHGATEQEALDDLNDQLSDSSD